MWRRPIQSRVGQAGPPAPACVCTASLPFTLLPLPSFPLLYSSPFSALCSFSFPFLPTPLTFFSTPSCPFLPTPLPFFPPPFLSSYFSPSAFYTLLPPNSSHLLIYLTPPHPLRFPFLSFFPYSRSLPLPFPCIRLLTKGKVRDNETRIQGETIKRQQTSRNIEMEWEWKSYGITYS